jgi:hypothetical protein
VAREANSRDEEAWQKPSRRQPEKTRACVPHGMRRLDRIHAAIEAWAREAMTLAWQRRWLVPPAGPLMPMGRRWIALVLPSGPAKAT